MTLRMSQALLVLCIGIYAALVVFGNITDYGTNYEFVRHVMRMDTIFPESTITYRAVDSDAVHGFAYLIIIGAESIAAGLCITGAVKMMRAHISKNHEKFYRGKRIAIAGLTVGFITWQFIFMSVGGEWFGMWMSHAWNGLSAAFRVSMTILGVLIFVSLPSAD